MAACSGLSIMSVATHYKHIMGFQRAQGWVGTVDVWSNLLFLSLFFSSPLYVCAPVCVYGDYLSNSETNYFRGGARLCERAALHVWQATTANLHHIRVALAHHHLVLATVSLRPHPQRVSHHHTHRGVWARCFDFIRFYWFYEIKLLLQAKNLYGLCIVLIYLPGLHCSVLAANIKIFLSVCMLTIS